MSSVVRNDRVVKWQPIAKIYTCMGRDIYIAAYVSAYVLAQCQHFNQCLLLWS